MKQKMKKFREIREAKKKAPPGEKIWNKKVSGIDVLVNKNGKMFQTYVDGDMLDEFPSLHNAKKAGLEFVKQAKG